VVRKPAAVTSFSALFQMQAGIDEADARRIDPLREPRKHEWVRFVLSEM
jgi:hypothetical protein